MNATPDANLPERADYVAAIFINASPQKVWSALTTPSDAQHVFGGKTEIGDVGEPWIRHAAEQWPAITGTVLAKTPPYRLLITWGFEGDPPPDRVEFLVETMGAVTRLTLKEYHGRQWPEDITDSGVIGWAAMLSSLKTLAETGKPMPSPFHHKQGTSE